MLLYNASYGSEAQQIRKRIKRRVAEAWVRGGTEGGDEGYHAGLWSWQEKGSTPSSSVWRTATGVL